MNERESVVKQLVAGAAGAPITVQNGELERILDRLDEALSHISNHNYRLESIAINLFGDEPRAKGLNSNEVSEPTGFLVEINHKINLLDFQIEVLSETISRLEAL